MLSDLGIEKLMVIHLNLLDKMVKVRARKFSLGAKLTEENGRIVKIIQVDNEFKNDTTTNGWLTENGKYILDNETH
jgi:hypothetical protein